MTRARLSLAIAAAASLAAATLAAAAPSAPPAGATAGPFSHAALDTVLTRFVHGERVDYGGLSRDRGALDRYLAAVATADPGPWGRAEQIAFWIDAYDAGVLAGVLRHPGLTSVMAVGKGTRGPDFFHERWRVAGRERSLDDIERGILRGRFREPRVHFVLNCASRSCPVLPPRAVTGAGLAARLEAATRAFLADTSRNRVEPGKGLWLSAIFDWYGDDFRAAAGSVPAFVARHWTGPQPIAPDLKVRFLPYDWSLNGTW